MQRDLEQYLLLSKLWAHLPSNITYGLQTQPIARMGIRLGLAVSVPLSILSHPLWSRKAKGSGRNIDTAILWTCSSHLPLTQGTQCSIRTQGAVAGCYVRSRNRMELYSSRYWRRGATRNMDSERREDTMQAYLGMWGECSHHMEAVNMNRCLDSVSGVQPFDTEMQSCLLLSSCLRTSPWNFKTNEEANMFLNMCMSVCSCVYVVDNHMHTHHRSTPGMAS